MNKMIVAPVLGAFVDFVRANGIGEGNLYLRYSSNIEYNLKAE
jgi:hypothetical protein